MPGAPETEADRAREREESRKGRAAAAPQRSLTVKPGHAILPQNGRETMRCSPISGQTAAICFLMLATALTPTPAASQAANAFDGTYAGVSRKLITQGGRGPQCEAEGVPESLVISNGVISAAGGAFEGSVNPQGIAVIRTPRGSRINAQVAQGTISGTYNAAGGPSGVGCTNTFVWQKQPR
jgi:hypothetical protein